MPAFKLILGTPLSAVPKPWQYMDIDGVMVNAYEILKRGLRFEVRGRGLRRWLGLGDDVELWIDSGGYQFLRSGVDPGVDKIARLYMEIDADYYVSMDYPPGPQDPSDVRAAKIAKTVRSYWALCSLLRDHVDEGRLVPVFHLATGEALRIQLRAYESSASVAAVGGLVPYFMQRAGRWSRLKAVLFLALLRKLWDGRLHALGLASAAVIPLLKVLEVDSGDTQTWRHKAAYGKIIIPSIGERHISSRKVRFGPTTVRPEEWGLVEDYVSKAGPVFGITLDSLRESFEARALFNVWVLKQVAENGYGYHGPSRPFRRLYEMALKLSKLPPDELEQQLSRILAESSPVMNLALKV